MAKARGNLEYFKPGTDSEALQEPPVNPQRIDRASIQRNS